MTQQNNILYEVITLYESEEWILNYHNILDFWSLKNMHHSPYHMIMDSLYLLKCLVLWLFLTWKIMWCHWYKGRQFWKILKTINWDIWWNMDFLNKFFYSFELIIQLLIFWCNYLSLIKYKLNKKLFSFAIWLVQYNVLCYIVYGLLF